MQKITKNQITKSDFTEKQKMQRYNRALQTEFREKKKAKPEQQLEYSDPLKKYSDLHKSNQTISTKTDLPIHSRDINRS